MRSLLAGLLLIALCSRETTKSESPKPREVSASSAATATPWALTAANFRGRNGQRFELACSGPPVIRTVWGTDLYTDDSSICTAAVHAGLIDQSGGTFTIEIRPGQDSYAGSERHGIVSLDYNSWGGSFVFVGKDGKPIEPPAGEGRLASWSLNASGHQGVVGKRTTYRCPPNGTFGSVWGTDVYTDDSSICTAAVHAGVITQSAGGPVTIEIRGGQPSFTGSQRNGVTSSDYGQWGASFVFVR